MRYCPPLTNLPVNQRVANGLLVVLLTGTAGLWAEAWYGSKLSAGVLILVSLGSAALWASGFAALCVLCRCRFCGHKLFWHAVGERDHSDGLGWFFTARQCPRCDRSRAAGDTTAQ